MRFPTDLRTGGDLKLPTEKVSSKEVEVALALIKQQTKPFIAEDYRDTYTEEIEKIIEEKAKGKKLRPISKEPKQTSAKDLMATLKASLK